MSSRNKIIHVICIKEKKQISMNAKNICKYIDDQHFSGLLSTIYHYIPGTMKTTKEILM